MSVCRGNVAMATKFELRRKDKNKNGSISRICAVILCCGSTDTVSNYSSEPLV